MSAVEESIRKIFELGIAIGELKAAREERDLLRERVKQLEAEKLERERKEGAK